jgi:REP element-mobilizing transposase RayT
VAQRFQRCDRLAAREAALAAEVLMAAPPRGNTGYSVYFITASTFQRTPLFRKEPMARLFVEVLFHYRDHKNYLLHEFVLMPDHFHLLISSTLSLERSLQLHQGRVLLSSKKTGIRRRKSGRRAFTIGECVELKTITTSSNTSAKIRSSRGWQLHSLTIPKARPARNCDGRGRPPNSLRRAFPPALVLTHPQNRQDNCHITANIIATTRVSRLAGSRFPATKT